MIWRTLAAVAALSFAWPAMAEVTQCGPTAEVLKHLKDKYNEMPYLVGMSASGAPLTITLAPSGTWTLMVAPDENHLCYVGAGKAMGRPV